MSVETHENFVKRLDLLGRKHDKMTRGYTTKVGRDGLIRVTPKRAKRGFPIKGAILLVIGFFVLKAFMVASVGPVSYEERLSTLQNGSVFEQYGAMALSIDPITQGLATQMGSLLK